MSFLSGLLGAAKTAVNATTAAAIAAERERIAKLAEETATDCLHPLKTAWTAYDVLRAFAARIRSGK